MRKLVAIAVLVLAGCGNGGGGNETPTVATPTFSPAAGTYHAVQDVSVTCATSGATIHYTVDGSAPTSASPAYGAAIHVATTGTTVKAMATAAGMKDSAVASATYTLQAVTPIIAPPAGTYATAQSVTITSATPSAAIHVTTDGTAPTAASPVYTAAIPLPLGETAATTTVKAMARLGGFADSAVASSTFVIDPAATPAAEPTFAPPAGTYGSVQSVAITTASSGASIYYTTDGSAPTTGSTLYAAPVQVAASLTLKAIATGNGHTASPVATAAYVLNLPPAATPTFNPGAGSYASAQTVAITSTTPGAVIYYTADGTTPTTASTRYTAPVTVSTSRTLQAIATAPGFSTSLVGTAAYVIAGGGSGFVTVCNGLFDKLTSLFVTCLHANPLAVDQLIGSNQFCADRQREIDAGLMTYSATQGAVCQSAIAALDCSVLSGGFGSAAPPACQATLTGTVAQGGTCWDSSNCAAGYCTWDLLTGTCPGTCQPFTAAGAACSDDTCGPGYGCDLGAAQPTCKLLSGTGGACPCQDALYCDTSGATATCRPFLATGATCTSFGAPCNLLTTCGGSPSTCQAYVGAGATCDPTDSQCGIGYDCTGTSTFTCTSLPALGDACDFQCLRSWCDFLSPTPTCHALLADGATCNPDYFGADCLSGSCNASQKCSLSRCVKP